MSSIKRERLSGWGLTPTTHCVSYRPEKERELSALVSVPHPRMIARGLGRSYGDASLQPEGVIHTHRLDHMIEFDPESGILRAQAGVSLAEVMEFSVGRGFLPPIIPGTKYVTLGGAFASNVHGKNQYKFGEFAEHVTNIRLLKADGRNIECSPTEHADIFWATAGGMGMTGIIEELSLKLRPIESASVRSHTQRVANIEAMVGAFEQAKHEADYMVGWIDHMAKGNDIGHGLFESAHHISPREGGEALNSFSISKPRIQVPIHAPSFLLNKHTMSLYNKWRFKHYDTRPKHEVASFNHFFHPLDSIGGWNRLYGRNGFFQYQCILPEHESIAKDLRELLTSLHDEKIFSFLAVIKYHRAGKSMLNFSRAGYSLALDLPNNARVRASIPAINRWVSEHSGAVYLAKDALMSPEIFNAMYPKHTAWKEIISDLDPHTRFSSMMSERLLWKSNK